MQFAGPKSPPKRRRQRRPYELHFSLDDESYFEALVRMFAQALKAIDTLPQTQRPALLARLDAVRQISHEYGYGVGEDMGSLLEAHGGCG